MTPAKVGEWKPWTDADCPDCGNDGGEPMRDKRGRAIGAGQLWTIHCGKVIRCQLQLMADDWQGDRALAVEPDEYADDVAADHAELHDLYESEAEAIAALTAARERGEELHA